MKGRRGLLGLRNAKLASQNAITAPRQRAVIPASTPEAARPLQRGPSWERTFGVSTDFVSNSCSGTASGAFGNI